MKSVSMNKPSAGDPVYLAPWLGTLAVFAAYVLVNLWLYQRVMDLIAHAANPFFVVVLVVITVLGQVLTIWQAKRILAEGRQVDLLNDRVKTFARDGRTQGAALEQELVKEDRNFDIDRLLRQLKNADGRTIRFDRTQLQHQFDGFAGDLQRRTLLPQYIANTLIGLGLFGTFLGLIVTLKEVALLIGMFIRAGADSGDDVNTLGKLQTVVATGLTAYHKILAYANMSSIPGGFPDDAGRPTADDFKAMGLKVPASVLADKAVGASASLLTAVIGAAQIDTPAKLQAILDSWDQLFTHTIFGV
ncbi:hypothetical protein [Herbaspirillum seropedicae]|uniref:hypothetical protein n=1 Tax=Herbaspirillum seropedicae TaxID=964 RepID=UPI003D984512